MGRLVPEKLLLTTLVVALFSLIPGSVDAATEVTIFHGINEQWHSHLDAEGNVIDPCFLFYDVNLNTAIKKCSWEWHYPEEIKEIIPPIEDSTDRPEWQKKVLDILNEVEDTPIEKLIEEQKEPEPLPQWKIALEEKKLETAEALTALEELLKDCEAIKERWSKIQDSKHIESLDIPKTMFAIDDYATAGKAGDFNLMFEECRGMIKFQSQIVQYENMIESASVVVDTTPSEQFEIDHEQKQAAAAQLKITEATRWLDWRCQPDQVKQGLCKENLDEIARDPNKGGFSYDTDPLSDTFGEIIGTVDCSYYYIMVDIGKRKKIPQKVEFCISDERARVDRENISPEELEARQKQEQCDEYMPHYAHLETIPEWLNHCAGYQAPPPEELQQTIETCPDCDPETMTKEQGVRHCYVANRGEVDCVKYDEDKAAKKSDN